MSELARRYARALFETAPDEQALQDTRDKLERSPELWRALVSPCVTRKQKDAVLARILPEENGTALGNFYRLLCRQNRFPLLDEIAEEYHALALESRGEADAELICAFEPDEAQKKALAGVLETRHQKRRVHLQVRRDESLIGGFVMKIGDWTYDRSVRGALSKLQNDLQAR